MGVYYYLVESKNIHNGLLFHESTIFLENKLLLVQMHFFSKGQPVNHHEKFKLPELNSGCMSIS